MDGTRTPSGLPLPERVDGWTDGYGYLRISDDPEGLEHGVERQEEDVRATAVAEHINLVGIFWDNDIGASTLSKKPRPAYDAMVAGLEAGKAKAIVSYTNGRLTRRPMEWLRLIDLANHQGVIIRTCKSGKYDLTTADGRAVAITIAAWDAAEVERLSERLRRQQLQHAQAGHKHQGMHRVFGYDRAFNIVEEEAKVVREVFKRKAKGESLQSIAVDLNSRGITTVKTEVVKGKNAGKTIGGGIWDASKVSSMIRRRDYIAEIAIKGEVVGPASFEPIVERAVWDAANEHVESASRAGKNARTSLLSGFLRCGTCYTKMKQGKGKDGTRYYCPSSKTHTTACGSNAIVGAKTDSAVFNAAWAKEQMDDDAEPALPKRNYAEEQARLTAEIEEVFALRKEEKLSIGDATRLLDDLRSKLQKIQREEASDVAVNLGAMAIVFDWENMSLSQKRLWIARHIKYVVVTKAEVKGLKGFKPERIEVHFTDGTTRRLSKGRVTHWTDDGPVTEEDMRKNAPKPVCSVDGCDRPAYAKTMCHNHYKADWRRRNKEKV